MVCQQALFGPVKEQGAQHRSHNRDRHSQLPADHHEVAGKAGGDSGRDLHNHWQRELPDAHSYVCPSAVVAANRDYLLHPRQHSPVNLHLFPNVERQQHRSSCWGRADGLDWDEHADGAL